LSYAVSKNIDCACELGELSAFGDPGANALANELVFGLFEENLKLYNVALREGFQEVSLLLADDVEVFRDERGEELVQTHLRLAVESADSLEILLKQVLPVVEILGVDLAVQRVVLMDVSLLVQTLHQGDYCIAALWRRVNPRFSFDL